MYLINDPEIAGDQIYTLFGRKPTRHCALVPLNKPKVYFRSRRRL